MRMMMGDQAKLYWVCCSEREGEKRHFLFTSSHTKTFSRVQPSEQVNDTICNSASTISFLFSIGTSHISFWLFVKVQPSGMMIFSGWRKWWRWWSFMITRMIVLIKMYVCTFQTCLFQKKWNVPSSHDIHICGKMKKLL